MNPKSPEQGAHAAENGDHLRNPSLIVFASNACIMTLELVAGRIIAPYVGVSLYTWTSILAVVLAGLSLGYYLGGKLADRFASRRTLSFLLLLAGLTSLSVPGIIDLASRQNLPLWLPLAPRLILFVAAIFFLPSAFLGTVSPLVAKLALHDLRYTGETVGRLYAASAAGSIAGTLATGFFLLSWFGSRSLLFGIGGALVSLGLLLGPWRAGWLSPIVALGMLSVSIQLPQVASLVQGPCLLETNYYCIQVLEDAKTKGKPIKILLLDRMIHSYVSPNDPGELISRMERVYAELSQYLVAQTDAARVLVIGGGGYAFPRYLAAVYPQLAVEVVEIDPGVTEIAYQHLGLPRASSIQISHQDARLFLNALDPAQQYDLIIQDAINDFTVPHHLTTLEFHEGVRRQLADDGLYVASPIDGRRRQFLTAYLRTLQRSFDHVYLVPVEPGWETWSRATFVIIASPQPLNLERLRQIDGGDGSTETAKWLLPASRLEELLANGSSLVLTDDYAPVENLLAPVYEDSRGIPFRIFEQTNELWK